MKNAAIDGFRVAVQIWPKALNIHAGPLISAAFFRKRKKNENKKNKTATVPRDLYAGNCFARA